MYLSYWRLKERPFEIGPDPKFFYNSPNHEEALQRLLFACHEHRGAMVLTGECGCGKTLLSRVLIRELARDVRCQIALIVNPQLSPIEILRLIAFELGVPKEENPYDKASLLDCIKNILSDNAKAGRETTLIIDEAQALANEEVFEEVRMLMNMHAENEGTMLLNVIFIAQPEFKERVAKLKQLAQRIQIWFHLAPLNEKETQAYIEHRLRVVGLDTPIFTPEAYQKVFAVTGGVPRIINYVCNMALWIGEKKQATQIDAELVETAFQGLKG